MDDNSGSEGSGRRGRRRLTRRGMLVAAGVLATARLASAGSRWLVTPEEARAGGDEADALRSRAQTGSDVVRNQMPGPRDAGAPRIELREPADLNRTLSSPLRVHLVFAASAPSAVIDPTTFRVLYGRLRLDITDRIRAVAVLTPASLTTEAVLLPAGSHRMTVEIADTMKNRASQQFVVHVA